MRSGSGKADKPLIAWSVSSLIDLTAWIPDTLRSFLAHAVENDGLLLPFPLVAKRWRLTAAFMKFVIPDRVSEERAERVGNPWLDGAEV